MKGMPSRPGGLKGAVGKAAGGGMGRAKQGPVSVKPGYGMKHQLRQGTMFPGMDTNETGVSDEMTDYGRMAAAGGMQ